MRKPPPLIDLAIILALAIVAVLGYKLSPLLQAKADLTVEPMAGCDLNKQACAADLPAGARLELSLTPHPIPLVKPLQVSVSLSGMVADKVEIDFAGLSMNMGHNRKILVADGQGGFSGEAMLPICITGRMVWQATLIVESGRQRIAVPYLFEAPMGGS
jgi:hypothetical protein